MKARYIFFLIIGIFILAITGCSKKSNVTFVKDDLSLMNDGMQYDQEYYDTYEATDEEIEYSIEYLSEYVKYYHYILNYEESYTSFTDEEKAAIITYASGLSFPQSIDYVKSIAKRYFDLDNYELPVGKYIVGGNADLSGEEWCIEKSGSYYKSSIVPRGIDVNRTIVINEVNNHGNEVILKGNYFVENLLQNATDVCDIYGNVKNTCIKGYYEYHLEKINKSLVLQSIKYTENKNYNKNASVSIYGA